VTDLSFWRGKKALVTGHTGFMGGWLATLLLRQGAIVSGYALEPPTVPSFCEAVGLKDRLSTSIIGDIRDLETLCQAMRRIAPDVVFHLAAQPLVRQAYAEPLLTYDVNVMGTVKVLEAVRQTPSVQAVVAVTTDKVYRNNNWVWPYREADSLGGSEPYSSSKACAEHVLDAYRHVYFGRKVEGAPAIGLASVRAGNVIGGGDWAAERLVPDAMRAFQQGKPVVLRHPQSTRPWQHVLDPLPGYLTLAQRLSEDPGTFSCGWNFGPAIEDAQPVGTVVARLRAAWGEGAHVEIRPDDRIFEERLLSLDSSKAQAELNWRATWLLDKAIDHTVIWYKAFYEDGDMWSLTNRQIDAFMGEYAAA